jgi:hypothetical protein
MDLDMISVGSGLPDPKTAEALAEKAEALVTSFRATIGNLSEAVSAARQRIESQHSSIVPTNVPKSQVQGIVGAVKVAVGRDVRAFTADLLKSSDHDRTEQLRQAKSHADSLASLLHVYPTPTSYLSGTTVSDPRRAQYVAALAHAGPAELSTYARQALATNDRALAAAIVSRNDALGEKGRLFSSLDFAKKFVGTEHAALDRAAKRAGAALQAMLLANRQLERGGSDGSTGRIALGLRQQAASSQPTDTNAIGRAMPGRK